MTDKGPAYRWGFLLWSGRRLGRSGD